ncbi:MAG: hypothetical protein K8T20_07890, partial [Planctomycetes bacterium]|nr:hypothetical protein [Planctomycetota bacterium]
MRQPALAAAIFALLALPVAADEPKTGSVDGEWKSCKYQLVVPSNWKKTDALAYTLFVLFPPNSHQGSQYGQLFKSAKGPKPSIALCLDGTMAAGDAATLVEKVRADYGFDPDKVFLVTYGEGAVRGFQFVNENADLTAGFIILQPSTGTYEPKGGGKSVPVLIMNDKACTYSPLFQAQGLKGKFESLGYEATLIETDDPANHDGWPTKDMGKFMDWAAAVVPPKTEDVFDAAAEWLKEGAKDTECRVKLRTAVKKYIGLYGDLLSPGGGKAAEAALATALKDAVPSVRVIKGGVKGSVALVPAAKGKKIEGGALVLCDSGEFESIEDSLVICSGDLKVNKITNSLVIVKGAVTVAKDV